MLALSTRLVPPSLPLARAVAELESWGLALGAVALHRPPRSGERGALGRRRERIVGVFLDAGTDAEAPRDPGRLGSDLLIVEAGEASADREASLEDLCRTLHALRPFRVALRTPVGPESHPSPREIALVHEAVPHVGYWHDVDRGGAAYLDAAASLLRGASFDAAGEADLASVRGALPSGAPVVVDGAPEAGREAASDAVRRARGFLRA